MGNRATGHDAPHPATGVDPRAASPCHIPAALPHRRYPHRLGMTTAPPLESDGAVAHMGYPQEGLVEMAGIEPASNGAESGLLRVQSAVLFSAPAITRTSRRRAQSLFDFPLHPVTGIKV